MFKREIKINLKGTIIWSIIISLLFTMMFLVFPTMKEMGEEMESVIQAFPPGMLKAFNFSMDSFTNVIKFVGSEGYVFYALLGSIYAAMLGSKLILKEESDKTIEYLYSKPISKNKIVTEKLLAGVLLITILSAIVSLALMIGFVSFNEFNFKLWGLLSIAPYILQLTFYFLSIFISTFFRKLKKVNPIVLGIVMGTYFFQLMSAFSEDIEFLKYLSPFEYMGASQITNDETIKILYLLICFAIMLVSIVGTYVVYNKKEYMV